MDCIEGKYCEFCEGCFSVCDACGEPFGMEYSSEDGRVVLNGFHFYGKIHSFHVHALDERCVDFPPGGDGPYYMNDAESAAYERFCRT